MEGEEGRADSTAEKVAEEEEKAKTTTAKTESDLEFLTCCLQPSNAVSDPSYVGIRRLLLYRKSRSGLDRRKTKKLGKLDNTKSINHTKPQDLRIGNTTLSHRTSFGSSASDADHPLRFFEPAYSFVGMLCIFDNCKASVTVLKFGHMRSDLLAYGASDGSLTVCTVSQPPSILQQLRGHSKDVTGIEALWKVVSSVQLWNSVISELLKVLGFGCHTRGCVMDALKKSFPTIPLSFILESAVSNLIDHNLTHRHKSSTKRKSPITTVQYRTFSLLARGPVLLVCAQDGSLSFFSVALEIQGYLTLRCSLKLAPRVHNIRASFCPLLSLEKGEFIVSGSEDSNVYFYDLTKPKHTCVNKLQGHGSPVIGVAWNHGENFLASSDSDGMVIVWKRAKNG
ncbi:hypothetical protein ACLOJK_020965 [Asimina triloba]